MSDMETVGVGELRRKNLQEMKNEIDIAFENRVRTKKIKDVGNYLHETTQHTIMANKTIANVEVARKVQKENNNDEDIIDLGKILPTPSMVLVDNSHDYPELIWQAYIKIQKAIGNPIDKNPFIKGIIKKNVLHHLEHEYKHSIPILGSKTEIKFGVSFDSDENGVPGFIPFMAFGGKIYSQDLTGIFEDTDKKSKGDEIVLNHLKNIR